jgi:PadR family transcriptional regulator, regulatory protein PadR
MEITKDLVAASATPIVLAVLSAAENYGYAIIPRVREVSDNRLSWTDGMLYPVLHRLEAAGFIRSEWRRADTGRRRKYYRITEEGAAELVRQREQWSVAHEALQRLTSDADTGGHGV